jgi:hypothetical protein
MRSTFNTADITLLRALGFKLVLWRHSNVAWVDVIPHRDQSLTLGINGQYCPQSLSGKLARVLLA